MTNSHDGGADTPPDDLGPDSPQDAILERVDLELESEDAWDQLKKIQMEADKDSIPSLTFENGEWLCHHRMPSGVTTTPVKGTGQYVAVYYKSFELTARAFPTLKRARRHLRSKVPDIPLALLQRHYEAARS